MEHGHLQASGANQVYTLLSIIQGCNSRICLWNMQLRRLDLQLLVSVSAKVLSRRLYMADSFYSAHPDYPQLFCYLLRASRSHLKVLNTRFTLRIGQCTQGYSEPVVNINNL